MANLIVNGNLESGTGSTTTNGIYLDGVANRVFSTSIGGGTLAFQGGVVHGGSQALSLSIVGVGWNYFSYLNISSASDVQTYGIPVDPAKKYNFRGWMKTSGVSINVTAPGIYLRWFKADGVTYAGSEQIGSLAGTQDWTEITKLNVSPPADAAYFVFDYLRGHLNAGGTIYFDDFSLTEAVSDEGIYARKANPIQFYGGFEPKAY